MLAFTRGSAFVQATTLLSLFSHVFPTRAQFIGFNYAANTTDVQYKVKADYLAEFKAAEALAGTDGQFTSARLYTMLQGDTEGPISAIEAAMESNTSLLLGMWASSGKDFIDTETNALLKAIEDYGDAFTNLVVGLSVGSEDVYRTTELGAASNAGPGATPTEIAGYIDSVRAALANTTLKDVKIGHVDTSDVWSNSSTNATQDMPALISKVDFIGFNSFPYWEKEYDNSIESAQQLFDAAWDRVTAAVNGKEIWVTETGWPVSGDSQNKAEASKENAAAYWKAVGCSNLAKKRNMWYYILDDDIPEGTNQTVRPVFGVADGGEQGVAVSTTPKFDMTCASA